MVEVDASRSAAVPSPSIECRSYALRYSSKVAPSPSYARLTVASCDGLLALAADLAAGQAWWCAGRRRSVRCGWSEAAPAGGAAGSAPRTVVSRRSVRCAASRSRVRRARPGERGVLGLGEPVEDVRAARWCRRPGSGGGVHAAQCGTESRVLSLVATMIGEGERMFGDSGADVGGETYVPSCDRLRGPAY